MCQEHQCWQTLNLQALTPEELQDWSGINQAYKALQEKIAERENKPYDELFDKLRRANIGDYDRWFSAYVQQGGATSEKRGVRFADRAKRFYVAREDFKMVPLQAWTYIVVPPGVKYLGGECGNSTIYILEADGTAWVDGHGSVYSFEDLPSVVEQNKQTQEVQED